MAGGHAWPGGCAWRRGACVAMGACLAKGACMVKRGAGLSVYKAQDQGDGSYSNTSHVFLDKTLKIT